MTWRSNSLLALCLLVVACSPDDGPKAGSQTNWLRACDRDAECGSEFACHCGACTRTCDATSSCNGLGNAECILSDSAGAIGVCDGRPPSVSGLCLPTCTERSCPNGQSCVAGVCKPMPEPVAHVVVDATSRYQTLAGFGASLAYAEVEVLNHPRKTALYRAMFSELGLDVLRLRNRYGYVAGDDLSTSTAIVAAATDALGRKPTVILTSWTPPASLKASGELICQGNVDTCTLAKLDGGGFDYAGYGAYWRSSLDAYANVGLTPDYFGIQNNPDFVPTSAEPGEGCRFLAVEGKLTVLVNGSSSVAVEYPGLAEATQAVLDGLVGLPSTPKLIAPEGSGVGGISTYLSGLESKVDLSKIEAISHHFYGVDPTAVDKTSLTNLGALGKSLGKPLFQTEMQSDGFSTAVLIHHALVTEGASAYLQGVLAGPASITSADASALITLSVDDFTLEAPYYAMRHYALNTDPGWVRVGANSDDSGLLSSAWLAPDESAVTLVLVNTTSSSTPVKIELGSLTFASTRVMRTVFDGSERAAELGALAADGVLTVPGRSIVTVAAGSSAD